MLVTFGAEAAAALAKARTRPPEPTKEDTSKKAKVAVGDAAASSAAPAPKAKGKAKAKAPKAKAKSATEFVSFTAGLFTQKNPDFDANVVAYADVMEGRYKKHTGYELVDADGYIPGMLWEDAKVSWADVQRRMIQYCRGEAAGTGAKNYGGTVLKTLSDMSPGPKKTWQQFYASIKKVLNASEPTLPMDE